MDMIIRSLVANIPTLHIESDDPAVLAQALRAYRALEKEILDVDPNHKEGDLTLVIDLTDNVTGSTPRRNTEHKHTEVDC